MEEQFAREALLIGADNVEKLHKMHVAVFGLGGVGGYTVEALARAGIGTLTLVDHDTVSVTNLNRQIIATVDTVGIEKTRAMEARVKSIAPNCRVILRETFFLPETRESFDFSTYDYVVDAIDTVSGKIALVECCKAAGTPIILAMGAGNKLDPTAFEVADIEKTSVCPLARTMRRELKARGIRHVKVVYSKEQPLTPAASEEESNRRSVPGSVSFVPGVAGLILAGEVIKDLMGVDNNA